MAASGIQQGPPIQETRALAKRWTEWVRATPAADLGEGLIAIRETGIDSLEAVFAEGVRRFDKSGEYAADGALGIVAWLRWKCRLSGPAAAERVTISRQLEQLPETRKAFASGDLGYQHVAVMARTAEHLGTAAVRKEETALVQRPKPWTRASSTITPSNSSTAWMRTPRSWRRTGPTRAAIFI